MKLGLALGYSGANMTLPVDMVRKAEALGYDSVWTAEAYGSDAFSPLAYLAAVTEKIRLGTGIIQLAARTPANAAMTAATIDALAGGDRIILGIGVSGPQIVEGWYGQPWGKPNPRIRDYVAIIRKILAREEPVTHDGKEISLPYEGPGSAGLAKPLRSILHMNPNIPIWLGTGTETNVRMTAEIAEGWLPLGLTPYNADTFAPWIEEGFKRSEAKTGEAKRWTDFEVQSSAEVQITDDLRDAFRRMKPNVALYVGGMGARSVNFHKMSMVRRGYGDAAERIQEALSRGTQGRGDRGGARRVPRRAGAARFAGQNPRALPGLGGQLHHRPDGQDGPTRSGRADGRAGEGIVGGVGTAKHLPVPASAPGPARGGRHRNTRAVIPALRRGNLAECCTDDRTSGT